MVVCGGLLEKPACENLDDGRSVWLMGIFSPTPVCCLSISLFEGTMGEVCG